MRDARGPAAPSSSAPDDLHNAYLDAVLAVLGERPTIHYVPV